jgi:16S rRNA processing protein RimM
MESLVQIGSIVKAHGVKGLLKAKVTPEFMEDILELESIFIGEGANQLPYFISHVEAISGNEILLTLEEIDSKEKADSLVKKLLYTYDEELSVELEDEVFSEVIGYLVTDKDLGIIGTIDDLIYLPQQVLAQIKYHGKEVLIPLHDDLILEQDDMKKHLLVDLPAGLLEIF